MPDTTSTDIPVTRTSPSREASRGRSGRPQAVLEVIRKERVTPQMVRVRLGGAGLADLTVNDFTDSYVKLLIPAEGSGLQPPYDLDALRDASPELLPARRTYTIRHWNLAAGYVEIDFVLHGTGDGAGVAARWAEDAMPGDLLAMSGAGGAYSPDPAAGSHLILGDHSALPAIARAVEALTPEARGTVLIHLDQESDQQRLEVPEGVELRWIIGDREQLLEAVRSLDIPDTQDVQVFAHAERGLTKLIRRELVVERSIPKDRISISAYWALGRIEDEFQAEKREPIGSLDA